MKNHDRIRGQINNEDEVILLKSFLERMNFSFKTFTNESVSEEEIKAINKGIDETNQGLLKDNIEICKATRALCLK